MRETFQIYFMVTLRDFSLGWKGAKISTLIFGLKQNIIYLVGPKIILMAL